MEAKWIPKLLNRVISLFTRKPKSTIVRGGDVNIGPGTYKAGDGGPGGKGGDLNITAGNARVENK